MTDSLVQQYRREIARLEGELSRTKTLNSHLQKEVARLNKGWAKANDDLLEKSIELVGVKDELRRYANAHAP